MFLVELSVDDLISKCEVRFIESLGEESRFLFDGFFSDDECDDLALSFREDFLLDEVYLGDLQGGFLS